LLNAESPVTLPNPELKIVPVLSPNETKTAENSRTEANTHKR